MARLPRRLKQGKERRPFNSHPTAHADEQGDSRHGQARVSDSSRDPKSGKPRWPPQLRSAGWNSAPGAAGNAGCLRGAGRFTGQRDASSSTREQPVGQKQNQKNLSRGAPPPPGFLREPTSGVALLLTPGPTGGHQEKGEASGCSQVTPLVCQPQPTLAVPPAMPVRLIPSPKDSAPLMGKSCRARSSPRTLLLSPWLV